MENEFIHLDLFDQYIHNELDVKSKIDFENRLKTDQVFETDFNRYKDMLKSISYAGEMEMRSTITSVQDKLKADHFFSDKETNAPILAQRSISSRWRWLAAAASVLLLMVAGLYFLNLDANSASQNVFVQFYAPEKNNLPEILDELEAVGLVNVEAEKNKKLAKGLRDYSANNYTEANQSLHQFLKEYPENKIAQLYLGLCFVEQKDYTKAIDQLHTLVHEKDFDFQPSAKWYSALSYLQLKTKEAQTKAEILLNQLVEEEGRFAEKAEACLKTLKK